MRFPFGDLIFYCFPKNIQKHENAISITFLIKSIMNKKLFSWKALAGLALLVAMGLTSCKQDTVVDPTDPYGTTKPVKPGTTTTGDADLTFTITNATGGDLATLWANWQKDNADAATALKKKTEVTIGLNFANYKLDGNEIAIPQFVTTTDGSIINLIVTNFAEAKKALNLSTANLAGAEVNITLPAAEFDMVLTGTASKVTLKGDATTLKTLKATASTNAKKALTVGTGVTVKGISMTGALADTDNVEAKLISAAEALVEGKGAQVGSEEVYVKSLIITADATVSGAAKTALKNVTVNEAVTLTLGDKKSQIASIKGLGDMTDATKRSTVKLAGDADDFSKLAALANVNISGTTATKITDFSIFENVIFNTPVELHTSAANTKFLSTINALVDDDVYNISFTNVDFGASTKITMGGGTSKVNKNSLIAMYQYDLSTENYVAVKDNDADNLSAANKKKDGKDVAQNYYQTWAAITTAGITWDGLKFHYATIETAETTLKTAKKAYDDKVKSDGYKAANSDKTITSAYALAWEALNGIIKTTKTTDDDGNNIAISFTAYTDTEIDALETAGTITTTAQKEAYQGLYRVYKNQWGFVTTVNAGIKDSAWFTLYFTDEKTIQPEGITLAFDTCTINGKDATVAKLNDLIVDPGFTSVKDAWFTVILNGEALQWGKYTDGTYYLK